MIATIILKAILHITKHPRLKKFELGQTICFFNKCVTTYNSMSKPFPRCIHRNPKYNWAHAGEINSCSISKKLIILYCK
jgi:hypothetical protein